MDLGFNWIADKSRAGDGATPEGRYRIVSRTTASAYYRALLLDYPNADDRAEFARARRSGDVPRSAGIGGLIEIHGEGGRGRDWTKGCVALANPDMADLFARVSVGTPVTIVGSDDFGAIAEFAVGRRDSDAADPAEAMPGDGRPPSPSRPDGGGVSRRPRRIGPVPLDRRTGVIAGVTVGCCSSWHGRVPAIATSGTPARRPRLPRLRRRLDRT